MDNIHILLQQAANFHNQQKTADADAIYRHILQQEPDNTQALHFHALIMANTQDIHQALSLLEETLVREPNRADFHQNTASIHARAGHKARAIELFSQAIFLQPNYAEAYLGLIECRHNRHEYDLLARIQAQIDQTELSSSQLMLFHFAAARICDESEDYQSAFQHIQKANSLKKQPFDIEEFTSFVDQSIDTFTPSFVRKHQENGLYHHKPVFILGMPRSGSSLVEQILASHSMVFGAGELHDIASIKQGVTQAIPNDSPYPSVLKEITPDLINGFALAYLKRIDTFAPDSARIINKHPLNFQHIGLIRLMFPNAQIIHTRRNPIDTCLSCYFQHFTNGQAYSFNLDNLADYYTQYHRLMAHWRSVFPNKILDMPYENLVTQTEASIRQMLKYCQLPWEDACLHFHKTERMVSTASHSQVRQPIHQASVNRWKHYDKPLQPFIRRLKHNIDALKKK